MDSASASTSGALDSASADKAYSGLWTAGGVDEQRPANASDSASAPAHATDHAHLPFEISQGPSRPAGDSREHADGAPPSLTCASTGGSVGSVGAGSVPYQAPSSSAVVPGLDGMDTATGDGGARRWSVPGNSSSLLTSASSGPPAPAVTAVDSAGTYVIPVPHIPPSSLPSLADPLYPLRLHLSPSTGQDRRSPPPRLPHHSYDSGLKHSVDGTRPSDMLIFPGYRDVIDSPDPDRDEQLLFDEVDSYARARTRDRSRSRRLERSLSPDTIAMRSMMIRYRLDPFTECGGEMGRRMTKGAKQVIPFPTVTDGPATMQEFQVDVSQSAAGDLEKNEGMSGIGTSGRDLQPDASGLIEKGLEPIPGHGRGHVDAAVGLPSKDPLVPSGQVPQMGMDWPSFDMTAVNGSGLHLPMTSERQLQFPYSSTPRAEPNTPGLPPGFGLRLSPGTSRNTTLFGSQDHISPPRLPPLSRSFSETSSSGFTSMSSVIIPSLPMGLGSSSSSGSSSLPFSCNSRLQANGSSQPLYPSPQAPPPGPTSYHQGLPGPAYQGSDSLRPQGPLPPQQRFSTTPGSGYSQSVNRFPVDTRGPTMDAVHAVDAPRDRVPRPGPAWQPPSLSSFRLPTSGPGNEPPQQNAYIHPGPSEQLHGMMEVSPQSYEYTMSGGSSNSISADDYESERSAESEPDVDPYQPEVAPSGTPNTANAKAKFHCQVCDKAFPKASTLATHMSTHTGERPYVCPVKGCGKRFSVQSNMRRHQKSCVLGLEGRKRIKKSLFADFNGMNTQPPGMAPTLEPLYATRLKVNRDAPAVRKARPRTTPRSARQTQTTPTRWLPESLKNCLNANALCSKGPFQYLDTAPLPLPPILPRGTPGEQGWEERNSFEKFPEDPYLSENFSKLPGPGLLTPEEHMRVATMSRRWPPTLTV